MLDMPLNAIFKETNASVDIEENKRWKGPVQNSYVARYVLNYILCGMQ